jgi:glutamate formiminotransferase
MRRILLCEPNISEGRDLAAVQQVADQVRALAAVRLLEATERLAVKTFELIDMTAHHGAHPRQGALDVASFIPVRGIETAEAVEIARRFGRFVGQLGVPVYFYEDAATRPERKSLPEIRKGEYEALAAKLADPAWAPDAGPAVFNARSGATVTGPRFPLVASNVNLRATDVGIADRIAKAGALCQRLEDGTVHRSRARVGQQDTGPPE